MATSREPARGLVLQRALEATDQARRSERHHSRMPLVDVALRDASETADGSWTISGHAATTNSEYVLFESAEFGIRIRERIASAAFDQVLAANPDVHLNINHDMSKAIARTGVQGVGGLELSMDGTGLRTFARVDRADPDVIGLASKMRLGIIDQMSFAFTIAEETRSEVDDGEMTDVMYEIQRVGQLYDVCVCAQGANPQTDSSLRSFRAAVGQPDALASWATHRQPVIDLGDVSVSRSSEEDQGVLETARAKRKRDAARTMFPRRSNDAH